MRPLKLRFADRAFQGPRFHLTSVDNCRNVMMGLHTHDYPEIFWLTQGDCLHQINGKSEALRAGDLVLMRAEDCHELRAGESRFTFTNLAIAPEVFAELRARYPEETSELYAGAELPLVKRLDTKGLNEANAIARDIAASPHSRFALDQALLRLWQLCLPTIAVRTEGTPEWLQDALVRLAEPEVFRQGASGLVAVAGRSHAHVTRTCKHHLGKTPSALANEARLQRATRLLRLSTLSVLEIALECGFENPAQFHRIFRSTFGTTPGRYRRS